MIKALPQGPDVQPQLLVSINVFRLRAILLKFQLQIKK